MWVVEPCRSLTNLLQTGQNMEDSALGLQVETPVYSALYRGKRSIPSKPFT
jgi:hypothetical protein